jgi:hypothetical protein
VQLKTSPRWASIVSAAAGAACLVIFSTTAALGSEGADSPDRVANDHAETKPKDAKVGEIPAAAPASTTDEATEHASFEIAAYHDHDAVTVFTPSVAVGIDNTSGASLRATYLVDVVSAASVDIVSTASPRWQEVRQAGSLYGEYKPKDFGIGVGTSISREPDYLSYGAYATIRKDFAEKNWSLFFGYGFSHDTAGRCGADGLCTPFSVFSRNLQRASFNGGVDLVVDRASLASITGDIIVENGDQSKPYRYVPMFLPEKAVLVTKGAPIDFVNNNRTYERPLEQLPLTRRRFALTGRYARQMGIATVRAMERLYADTWGLMASSTDARLIFDLGKRFEIWPHARFHYQHEVNFWKLAYVSRGTGWDLPLYRTGDRELGPLFTVGGGFGAKVYLGPRADVQRFAVQLTADAMYTSFLDDLYVTGRLAGIGALGMEGSF